jgi:hypothetical protein
MVPEGPEADGSLEEVAAPRVRRHQAVVGNLTPEAVASNQGTGNAESEWEMS